MKVNLYYKWLCIQVTFWKLLTPLVVMLHFDRLTVYCCKKVIVIGFQLLDLAKKQQVYNKHHLSA